MRRDEFLRRLAVSGAAMIAFPFPVHAVLAPAGVEVSQPAHAPVPVDMLDGLVAEMAGPRRGWVTTAVTTGPRAAEIMEAIRADYAERGAPFGDTDAGINLELERDRWMDSIPGQGASDRDRDWFRLLDELEEAYRRARKP